MGISKLSVVRKAWFYALQGLSGLGGLLFFWQSDTVGEFVLGFVVIVAAIVAIAHRSRTY